MRQIFDRQLVKSSIKLCSKIFITTRLPLTSFGDYSSARTSLFIDHHIWLFSAFQKTRTQNTESSNQNAELYIRARGKNTKPDIVIEVIRYTPVTSRTADSPPNSEPGAAAYGAFSIGFDDFACFRIIWIGQIQTARPIIDIACLIFRAERTHCACGGYAPTGDGFITRPTILLFLFGCTKPNYAYLQEKIGQKSARFE